MTPPGVRVPEHSSGARTWLLAALDLVFPAICPVCGSTLGAGRRDPLCADCWNRIDRIAPPWCERCGLPVHVFERPDPRVGPGLCQACAAEPPAFAYARAAAYFADPLRDAIHALKFRGKRAIARPLADLLAEQLTSGIPADVAALVPVPLAPARHSERGFNQAALIAERLGRVLGLPVRERWLRRTRSTPPQTELSAAERRANVRSAFVASTAVAGLHVVLVDDVLTTGATASECARALGAAGARTVGVLTVARVV